jgi:uncharacterized OsmC-like protein
MRSHAGARSGILCALSHGVVERGRTAVTSILKPLWRDLADQCRADPAKAVSEMRAVCDSAPRDPLKWTVTGSPGTQHEMEIGLHPSVGGDGSAPCPGELVTMALAACMDGSIRLFADLMEIEVDRIRVEVVSRADIRAFLRVTDVDIPGDTGITMTVDLEASGASEEQLAKLREIAEAASGVLHMLRSQIPVELSWS